MLPFFTISGPTLVLIKVRDVHLDSCQRGLQKGSKLTFGRKDLEEMVV